MSDLLLLDIAMYRSWLIDHRGHDLHEDELNQLLRDLQASERLGLDASELAELLDASLQPEHHEALRSLRKKTGFDERVHREPDPIVGLKLD